MDTSIGSRQTTSGFSKFHPLSRLRRDRGKFWNLADHFLKLTSFESAGMDARRLPVGPSRSVHDLCRKSAKVSQAEWYAKKVTDTRGKIKWSCGEGKSLSSEPSLYESS